MQCTSLDTAKIHHSGLQEWGSKKTLKSGSTVLDKRALKPRAQLRDLARLVQPAVSASAWTTNNIP